MPNQFIPLQQAVDMTTRYRDNKTDILKPEFQTQKILLLSETFDRAAFDSLLAQDGCVKLRFYFGMDEQLTQKIIAVGVNAQNEDILPAGAGGESSDGGIVEEGVPCPDWCPPPSPLNGE